MKLPTLACSLFVLLAAGFVRAESYSIKEPFTETASFSPTGELDLHNVNGSVTVRTWDKDEIRIEGVKSAKTEEELEKIDMKIELSESRAYVKVRLPKRDGGWFGGGNIRAAVQFTITLPATATIAAMNTVNSSVNIDGVRGPVHAKTVNGGIRGTDLGGSASLKTVNGTIRARFASLAASQRLTCETVNGQIEIALPRDAGAELHASVVNGHIDCDFPIQLRHRGRRSLDGKIGDGRAGIEVRTVNGSVSIEQR